jgi:hypothetical protein
MVIVRQGRVIICNHLRWGRRASRLWFVDPRSPKARPYRGAPAYELSIRAVGSFESTDRSSVEGAANFRVGDDTGTAAILDAGHFSGPILIIVVRFWPVEVRGLPGAQVRGTWGTHARMVGQVSGTRATRPIRTLLIFFVVPPPGRGLFFGGGAVPQVSPGAIFDRPYGTKKRMSRAVTGKARTAELTPWIQTDPRTPGTRP